jgi:hypothetical protein
MAFLSAPLMPWIVFGHHEDVGVKGRDLRRPFLRVLFEVLAHRGRHRLIEQGQVVIFDVHTSSNLASRRCCAISFTHRPTASPTRPAACCR